MSKELEALERIDNTLCLNNNKGKLEFGIDTEEHTDCDGVIGMTEDLETIKSALTEYEAIKNAEPSELVKKLADISYFIMESYSDKEPLSDNQKASRKCFLDYCKEIKQSLIQAEQDKKKATCWNIVVEKNVDVSLIKKYDFVEDYNSAVWIAGRPKLVKEEFNLLKEGLE